MRVTTFNLHAGIDGWGRPTSALEHAASLGADVLVLPELWRGDTGDDLFAELKKQLGMQGVFAPLARGERVTSGHGGTTWQPRLAHLVGEQGLYFDEYRSLTRSQQARRNSQHGAEHGEWGIGVLTRFEVEEVRVESLGRLPRERVQRALIIAKLRDGERSFYVLAIHGAHLSHGSYRHYRKVNSIAAELGRDAPVLLAGDFNCWRPLLRVLLPGWHSMVRARTWPAHKPHSQIDHVLARGPWRRVGGFASDGGSDHLALVADVELD